ncbi:hypothetical protein ZIOFF_002185 [Zingiber officinale]|uniref:Uncharacterized protein n=1 Tax=Zingiber officinale TaxID=94328 RepID=A0A8J5LSQ5_ZINOF|nr:hypothetical protein ZIOFF_002185 [Zingiber officinale]
MRENRIPLLLPRLLELIMEPLLKWTGNPNVTVVVKAFGLKATAQVLDLQVIAIPWITLKPLVPNFPCFAKILASLMEKPHVDFGLKLLGADVMSIPGLYRFVQVGGRDTVLVNVLSRRIPLVSDRPTIIFGADVTHSHPGEDSSPSIIVMLPKLISAMKGSRAQHGSPSNFKLHVKWAPDVYDPPCTLLLHTVKKNHHQLPKARKNYYNKHRTKSARGSNNDRRTANRSLTSYKTESFNASRSRIACTQNDRSWLAEATTSLRIGEAVATSRAADARDLLFVDLLIGIPLVGYRGRSDALRRGKESAERK